MSNELTTVNEIQMQNEKNDIINIAGMQHWYNSFVKFSESILKDGIDYGKVPGVAKASLFKPGAEKLRFAYNLGVEVKLIDKQENLEKNYLDYTYKAKVFSREGRVIAECDGNCNSYEAKFRYVWINKTKPAEQKEVDRIRNLKQGRFIKGKDNEWIWQEREENQDIMSQKNTLLKMAQKRAFVGAILMATGASEFYTQDIEDLAANGVIDVDEYAIKEQTKKEQETIYETFEKKIKEAINLDELKQIADEIKENKKQLSKDTHSRLLTEYSKKKVDLKKLEIKTETENKKDEEGGDLNDILNK